MRKGRSSYSFEIKYDKKYYELLITSFLKANNFNYVEYKDEAYYAFKTDIPLFNKYFNFSFNDNKLCLFCWIKGIFGEYVLDMEKNSLYAFLIKDYNILLEELIKKIESVSSGNIYEYLEYSKDNVVDENIEVVDLGNGNNNEVQSNENVKLETDIVKLFSSNLIFNLSLVTAIIFLILDLFKMDIIMLFVYINIGIGIFAHIKEKNKKNGIFIIGISALNIILELIRIVAG